MPTRTTTKPCACGEPRHNGTKCRSCYNAYMRDYMDKKRKTDSRYSTRAVVLARYNLNQDDYDRLLSAQDGQCGICGTSEPGQSRWFEIDHDHACCDRRGSCGECIRGLLCTGCNTGISRFRDDPALLRSAASYLEDRA